MFKKTASFLWKSTTYPYRRAAQSVTQLGRTTKYSVEAIKATIQRSRDAVHSTDPEIIEARKIKDGKQRYEYLYKIKGWDDEKIAKQERNLKISQAINLISMLGIMFISLYFLVEGFKAIDVMTASVGLVVAIGIPFFGLSAFQNALFKTQIQKRDLISPSQFIESSDFYKKALLPWS